MPGVWWPIVRTWIDPASNDPRAFDKALARIAERGELWRHWELLAKNAARLGVTRDKPRRLHEGQSFDASALPGVFWRANGAPVTCWSEAFRGPYC